MAEIVLDRISKVFSGGVKAVDDVSLRIADGEFIVLVGPSGCGKSTLLRMIAGLEDVDTGAISIGGRDVTDLQPRDRDIAMVFQSYALYPHMTVRQNLGYGLKVRRVGKQETEKRVERVARLLRLDELLDRRPAALSGGQRQRVAMGRAIVREPEAFLMDEPLSNLDAKLRVGMRAELASLHARVRRDDRLRHARPGRGDDAGRPGGGDASRPDPAGRLAQGALPAPGEPLRRVVHGVARDEPRRGPARRHHARVRRPPDPARARARPRRRRSDEIVLGIRPESFEDASFADPSLPQLDVEVTVLEDLGSDALVVFHLDATPVHTEELRRDQDEETLLAREGAKFTARVDVATAARPGAPLRLAVDPAGFHYFDRETGESCRRGVESEHAAALSDVRTARGPTPTGQPPILREECRCPTAHGSTICRPRSSWSSTSRRSRSARALPGSPSSAS